MSANANLFHKLKAWLAKRRAGPASSLRSSDADLTNPFTAEELEELEITWRALLKRFNLELTPDAMIRGDGSLTIHLKTADPRGSALHITRGDIRYEGASGDNDDAIRAGLFYFKQQGAAITYVHGDSTFQERVRARAQEMGVEITPPQAQAPQEPRLRETAPMRPSTYIDPLIANDRTNPNSPLMRKKFG